jgi:hypothetical protein
LVTDGSPLTLPFDVPYWLGVTVDSDPEMIERIELTAGAYALNAQQVLGSNSSLLTTSGTSTSTLRHLRGQHHYTRCAVRGKTVAAAQRPRLRVHGPHGLAGQIPRQSRHSVPDGRIRFD